MHTTNRMDAETAEAIFCRALHHPPLGYKKRWDIHAFEADPELFPVIRKVWDLALEGLSFTMILHRMNEEQGFRTPPRCGGGGRPLSRAALSNILNDPTYAGRVVWHGKTYPSIHQPMVTDDEFGRVKDLLHRHRRRRQRGPTSAERAPTLPQKAPM
jgi:hypothetical protein